MTPTDEQQAIIDAARSTDDNLLVSALAGAAKTTTLVMVAQALSSVPTLCVAFNRRIADEMTERLPGNCASFTLNSLGHRSWMDSLGKRLRVDAKKNYNILRAIVDELPKGEKEEAFKSFADTLRAVAFGKACGYIPTDRFDNAKRLVNDEEFFAALEEEPTALQKRLIRDASIRSLEAAWQGSIDFDDQVLMPTVFGGSFPRYPLVLVDEVQDLSELNHAMLKILARERLIAVGDDCQSIYEFRGAAPGSMRKLREAFSMQSLELSISFRCPQAVIIEAQWRAPHMRWPDGAERGEVADMTHWSVADLPETATILCRNNAPIFSMAIALLTAGRYPQIIGGDIAKTLVKTLRKLGNDSMPQADALRAVDRWEEEKLAKSRAPRRVSDQAECLRVFLRQGADIGEAIAYAEHVMKSHGPIVMSTIHKAKGMEWDNVFLLDKHLIHVEDQQDANLLYVAQTRAKQRLVYVTTEGYRYPLNEEGA